MRYKRRRPSRPRFQTEIKTVKTFFLVAQEALTLACEYIRKVRADMGGTNVLEPLSWILRQPMIRGHPRLLFLLTDGAVSNTGKVIELVRRHARYIRQVEGFSANGTSEIKVLCCF